MSIVETKCQLFGTFQYKRARFFVYCRSTTFREQHSSDSFTREALTRPERVRPPPPVCLVN